MITPTPVVPEKTGCIAGMSEDPFLWRTTRGWHILYHGMCPTGIMQAHYAFSQDAVHWTESTRQAYSYAVKYTDGSSNLFARMERPQLVFSEGGTLTHIFNGVCSGEWDCNINQ